VELLQGRFSQGVMERICRQKTGLFPAPAEIELSCSCPDWASMCKHVAAVLYGVGARLDARPELLFTLRQVDAKDLIATAGTGLPLSKAGPAAGKVLVADDLSRLFGLELSTSEKQARTKPARGGRGKTKAAPPAPDVVTKATLKSRPQPASSRPTNAKRSSKSRAKPKPRR
jgi:uncharacterized Zn finger protein